LECLEQQPVVVEVLHLLLVVIVLLTAATMEQILLTHQETQIQQEKTVTHSKANTVGMDKVV
jgi:hypothetical protein